LPITLFDNWLLQVDATRSYMLGDESRRIRKLFDSLSENGDRLRQLFVYFFGIASARTRG
jgi:hypothetical protein